MLLDLISEIQQFGHVILFGSCNKSNRKTVNDIDLTLVVPTGTLKQCKTQIRKIVKKQGISALVYLQDLHGYDRCPPERLIHLLVIEEDKLLDGSPIVNSVLAGKLIRVTQAAA